MTDILKARASAYRRAQARLTYKFNEEFKLLYQEELNKVDLKSRQQTIIERYGNE
jgi:hypothetical protein